MRKLLVVFGVLGLALFVGHACDSDDGGCADDFDCPGEQVCKLSTSSCEPFVCKADDDCTGGQSCDDNVCK
ncbi:MAG: hypothetical protein CSA66_01390 [Proteobacteria bacterium]|nr:MAG: hypothetical protein CSA66_01390 [Pseudomonadota bacterium]